LENSSKSLGEECFSRTGGSDKEDVGLCNLHFA
jgi:hypothetical protein